MKKEKTVTKLSHIDINDFFETTDDNPYIKKTKSFKKIDSRVDDLYNRVSFDIDDITKDCVFIYLFGVLAGRGRVDYVRDLLCKSGVDLGDLKQKVLSIDYREKCMYFNSFYNHIEDMFYEDVALSVSELVKDNKYIVKSILDTGVGDNKEAIRIGEKYINFYNLNRDFIQRTYDVFCDDDDIDDSDASKSEEFLSILTDIRLFSEGYIENFLHRDQIDDSLEKVSYLFLLLVSNIDVSNGCSQNLLMSYILGTLSILKRLKENGLFESISYKLDKKISWCDEDIFDSIYISRCIDRWTNDMMGYIETIPDADYVLEFTVACNNAFITGISGINLPINYAEVSISRDFVYNFYVKEYYRYWASEVGNRDSISKLDLNKYMPERNLEVDFYSILSSYSVVNITSWVKEMYEVIVKSSEIFKSVGMLTYSDEVKAWEEVKHLREELSKARKELEGSNDKYTKLLNDVRNKKGNRDGTKVINEYKKELSTKDEEIKRLQGLVDSQKEFLDLIESEKTENKEVNTEIDDKEDLSMLQSKSFIFVSRNNAINDAIKRLLPNSKFANSFTFKGNQTVCDGVILIIGSISHSLYFKWVSQFKGTSTPVYAYIGKNAGKLLNYLKEDMVGKRDCFEVGSSCKRIN